MLTGIELDFEGLEIQKLKKTIFFVIFADDSKILV